MPTNETAAALEAVIEMWRGKLQGVDSATAHFKPAVDRWSISEVIGHLVDSACNNHQRFVRAQFCDRLVFPKYEQNEWVAAGSYRQADWSSLVDLWYFYNRQLAVVMRNIPASSLATPCEISADEPGTVGHLVTDYLDHMQHHLRILEDRIAKQMGE